MKTIEKVVLAVAVSLGLFGASLGMAFEDGLTGSTSDGEFEIRLVKEAEVKISNLSDITIVTPDIGSNPVSSGAMTENACLYSNSDRASIQLTSTNLNTFQLDSGTEQADYLIDITGSASKVFNEGDPTATDPRRSGFESQTVTWSASDNGTTKDITWEASNLSNCGGTGNITIAARVPTLPNASGVYTDIVEILVAPL